MLLIIMLAMNVTVCFYAEEHVAPRNQDASLATYHEMCRSPEIAVGLHCFHVAVVWSDCVFGPDFLECNTLFPC